MLERGDIVEKKKLTSVYIGAENYRWIKALADAEGRSFSNTLDRIISEVKNERGD